MLKRLFIVFFSLLGFGAMAQEGDSLKVMHKDGSWAMKYTMKTGENIRMLAVRFCVSENGITNANDAETMRKPGPGTTIRIPVIPENLYTEKQPLTYQKEIYYEVANKDELGVISTYSNVTKATLRSWNGLKGNTILPGMVLMVGWVKMIPKDTANPATLIAYPSRRKRIVADTARIAVPGGLDTVYARQTENGLNVLSEKGTAVFFDKGGKGSVYLAFHNTARRGTIIKVYNPGNGRTIYARVLGPVPNTKQYAGCIIGISDGAREALGVSDSKAWCELAYSPN